ncbi:MAG: hypothetical protein WA114_01025, partial [Psychrobacter glacincola]
LECSRPPRLVGGYQLPLGAVLVCRLFGSSVVPLTVMIGISWLVYPIRFERLTIAFDGLILDNYTLCP